MNQDKPLPQSGLLSMPLAWGLLSLLCGALSTLAFAPFDLVPLVFISLAAVLFLWLSLPLKQAVISGWLYSMGLQLSGVSWIFYSLHTYGNAPAWFAVLLIFLLSCYLGIYPALMVYTVRRLVRISGTFSNNALVLLLVFPAAWILFEWLQGYVMTGFAWMQLGYTQLDTPLAGFAPVLGAHGVSGLVVFTGGVLCLLFLNRQGFLHKRSLLVAGCVTATWISGALLQQMNWTKPAADPINVSVIQGNFEQAIKWKQHMKQPTLDLYKTLTLEQTDADLVVWPETAVPDYQHRVKPYLRHLGNLLDKQGTDLVLGIFVREQGRLLNSAVTPGGDVYSKRHLVPLGEFIPLRSLVAFFNQFVKIPMSDIASGEDEQDLIVAAGVPLGISICFEEAFARDVIKDLPEAAILVNLSNDAWFEDSHQLEQQNAIGRMRALEAGRFLIRSTNTGITSLIAPDGSEVDRLPPFETGVLKVSVTPMTGSTPFVYWGDLFIVSASALLLLILLAGQRPQ